MKYTLDTSILIRAMRDADFNVALQAWMRDHGPHLFMHQVALTEVLVGARDPDTRARWRQRWQAPAEAVGRLVVPDAGAWDLASTVIARLRGAGKLTSVSPGFLNDCLIASSCLREGITPVTDNAGDAALIAMVLSGFRYIEGLP